MGIFERFRSARTSDDFASLEADQARQLATAEAALAALKAERVDAIGSGDDARVETLRSRIAEAAARCEELTEAVEVARTRRGAAIEREREAALAARRDKQRELRDAVILPMMQDGVVLFAETAAFAVEMRRTMDLFEAENRRLIQEAGPEYAAELPTREWGKTINTGLIEESLQRQRARGAGEPRIPDTLKNGEHGGMTMPWGAGLVIPGIMDSSSGATILDDGRTHWLAMVFPRLKSKIAAAVARRRMPVRDQAA